MISPAVQHKITADHLHRRAVVYLRQSSEKQVKENLESQRLQYALVGRARELGWQDVEVIDVDLGRSAAVAGGLREGFERLVTAVAMGEVGIVLSREVSRLVRTDKDWCHLAEVCQIFGTLIGDAEQVYDLSGMDDQLVLGIKATLSVIELKVLRLRLLQGIEEKARRGELFTLLPPGYVGDGAGGVCKDPNERVQEAIRLIFTKFRELRSVRQVFLWIHSEGVEMPVNQCRGGRRSLGWKLPSRSYVLGVLQNPFYAGAYVWGRREKKKLLVDGRLVKRAGRIYQAHESRVFLRDHHEGYIDWESFEDNLRTIRSNCLSQGSDEAVGAIRAGQGLLAGLLRCGRCGRKLHVHYWGRSGTIARYLCKGAYDEGGSYCLAFSGKKVDERFCAELLQVLSPLGVRASLAAIERLRAKDDEHRRLLARKLEQCEYEARRAFEQYNEVDPRNRLVAAELERRWNAKLEEVEGVKSALGRMGEETAELLEEEEFRILRLGERLSDVWESDHCPVKLKKKIIRAAVEEVIANLDETGRILDFIVHWKGGDHSRFEMPKPEGPSGQKTSMDDIDLIRRMAVRYGDGQIAAVLNRHGRLTGKGNRWTEQRVATVRRRHSIPGQRTTIQDPDILSLRQAVSATGVGPSALLRLAEMEIIKMNQIVPWAPWEIRRSDLESEAVQEALRRLKETGTFGARGDVSKRQQLLF